MNEQTEETGPPEMSRPFHIGALDEAPEHHIDITATAAERVALAERCALRALHALTAQMSVRREVTGEIVVTGRLHADVVQDCVVTLEPVADTVDSPFEQRYTQQPEEAAGDLEIGPGEVEPPEPVAGDRIDLGELVAQFLALSVNPYPRAPDADAEASQYLPDSQREGPFAILAKLRENGQS